MTSYVLDCSQVDASHTQHNKTVGSASGAKNNFMPSIAKKPMFLMYSQRLPQPLFLGKTLKCSE